MNKFICALIHLLTRQLSRNAEHYREQIANQAIKQRESGRKSTYERRWITPLNAFQRTPRDMGGRGKATEESK